MRRWSRAALLAALLGAACGAPPNKEMDQAQGAIDAARAAGAEQYAPDRLEAAIEALAQANQAVAQRDYRLALNYALESREHAQNAAREAADNRARIRGEVERAMAEATALLAQANAHVDAAERSRVSRRTLREAQEAIARINADVQKAGATVRAGDYMTAQRLLSGLDERTRKVIAALDAARSQISRRHR
jgi:hypothetical protein